MKKEAIQCTIGYGGFAIAIGFVQYHGMVHPTMTNVAIGIQIICSLLATVSAFIWFTETIKSNYE